MDSLCFCASDAITAITISLDTLAVSMPCSSNKTLTPSSLSSRTAARQSFVFRAKREMDLTRIRRAGDTFIGVNIDHFPIWIARDEFGIVLILDAVGVELILAGGADAGVGCNAQLSCYHLIVHRDDYDALLFQREISVSLLLCHAVHLSL